MLSSAKKGVISVSSQKHFDPHTAFFVLDSENLDRVETAFYGFTILGDKYIYQAEDLQGRLPEGDGAYVYILRQQDKISIFQDFMGSYGLYLFQKEGYFAISNSFIMLVDHVKRKYPLTLNQDYADFFLTADLCSVSYDETMIREISCLDRCVEVEICISSGNMTTHWHDYKENTVPISSREGMEILDNWFRKWTALIRSLKEKTNNIQTDLTGGFDSRLVFNLLLGSGANLNDIFIFSIHDNLHTHSEDYEIASAMAAHYGCRLNDSSLLTPGIPWQTPDELLNISLYTKLGFHKQIYIQPRYYEPPRYNFVGNGGECIRDYWNMTAEEYIQKAMLRVQPYPANVTPRLKAAIRRILETSFRKIQEKFTAFGRPLSPDELTLNLYRETRCRNHFAKAIVERFLASSITCAPLLDPQLHRLKCNDGICADKNLLIAILLTRFDPDLLNFKFDNHRHIHADTIRYAQKLNSQFPFTPSVSSRTLPTVSETIPAKLDSIPAKTITDTIMDVFRSQPIKDAFLQLYSRQCYQTVCHDIDTRKFYPLQNAYAVISISKAFLDVQLSRQLACRTLTESLCLETAGKRQTSLMDHPALTNWITARVDLKAAGSDIELLSVSDEDAKITSPSWFCKDSRGYILESQKGSLTVRVRSCGNGTWMLALRGRDVRDSDGQRIPFWIDYTKLTINGKDYISHTTPICHDVPLKLELPAAEGNLLELALAWEPHDEQKQRCLTAIPRKKQ